MQFFLAMFLSKYLLVEAKNYQNHKSSLFFKKINVFIIMSQMY